MVKVVDPSLAAPDLRDGYHQTEMGSWDNGSPGAQELEGRAFKAALAWTNSASAWVMSAPAPSRVPAIASNSSPRAVLDRAMAPKVALVDLSVWAAIRRSDLCRSRILSAVPT